MNPEDSKQFDEIMGRNFTANDQKKMVGDAVGAKAWSDMEGILGSYRGAVEHEANQRMALFPEHMMSIDEDGRHVSYTSPSGWKHTWHGGEYIEHSHPKQGVVDVTNVSNRKGELPTLAPEEFLQHAKDAEEEHKDTDFRYW